MTVACAGLSLLFSLSLALHTVSSVSLTRLATGWGQLHSKHETSLVPELCCSERSSHGILITKLPVGTGLREKVARSSRQPWQNAHRAHKARLWHTP